uniref:Sushi domain-containing protein n=1 Tax=Anolis carolinensis TaxID=28377 RepID=A0A803TP19_ANOCA
MFYNKPTEKAVLTVPPYVLRPKRPLNLPHCWTSSGSSRGGWKRQPGSFFCHCSSWPHQETWRTWKWDLEVPSLGGERKTIIQLFCFSRFFSISFKAKHCEYPRIEHGALSWSNTYYSDVYFPKKEGDTINFRCYRGFLPENKKRWHIIRCTSYGWEPEPKCFSKCIFSVLFHKIILLLKGDDITLSCDTGYYPANQQTKIMCTKNGWSPTPSCVSPVDVEKCGRPPSIENGDILDLVKEQYESGERVIYKCQRFYNMEGNAAVNCQNGNWSDTPKCIGMDKYFQILLQRFSGKH